MEKLFTKLFCPACWFKAEGFFNTDFRFKVMSAHRRECAFNELLAVKVLKVDRPKMSLTKQIQEKENEIKNKKR